MDPSRAGTHQRQEGDVEGPIKSRDPPKAGGGCRGAQKKLEAQGAFHGLIRHWCVADISIAVLVPASAPRLM